VIISSNNQPYLGFMQDQPMVHARDLAMKAICFPTSVAEYTEDVWMAQPQLEALNKIIERQGWAVPPRFRPFADTIERPWLHSKKSLYRIMLCPGWLSRRPTTSRLRL